VPKSIFWKPAEKSKKVRVSKTGNSDTAAEGVVFGNKNGQRTDFFSPRNYHKSVNKSPPEGGFLGGAFKPRGTQMDLQRHQMEEAQLELSEVPPCELFTSNHT